MNIKLRDLQADDYPPVCAWAMQEHWPGLVKGEVLTPEEFPKILSLAGHLSFCISEEEARAPALGFGQIWLSPNGRTNLVRVIVDPALRGRGIGKQLCSLLLAQALGLPDVSQVFLKVRRDNLPAIAVYRSLGFNALEEDSHAQVLAMAYGLKGPAA